MQNLQKNKALVGVALILIIGGGIYMSKDKTVSVDTGANLAATTTSSNTTANTSKSTSKSQSQISTLLGGKCNLTIISPAAGATVTFPLVIKGIIDHTNLSKYPCVWDENFTQAGTAQLFHNFNNYGWKSPGVAIPIVTSATNYTTSTSTISFSIVLNFFNQGVGLPAGSPIKITFIENTEKNQSPVDTFDFFVYLKQ